MPKSPLFSRPVVTAEKCITIAAVALTAFVFAQPQVLALAGFDFDMQHTTAERANDRSPTGSIKLASAHPLVHGLSGTLKPLRARD